MKLFRMIDNDGSWDDFSAWILAMDPADVNRAKFSYMQTDGYWDDKIRARFRVFAIFIRDDSIAAYFKLRWGQYLI